MCDLALGYRNDNYLHLVAILYNVRSNKLSKQLKSLSLNPTNTMTGCGTYYE